MSDTNSIKQCTKCKNIKPLSDFHNCARSKDGLRSECKECSFASHAKYRKTDAGKISKRKSSVKYRKSDAGKFSLTKYIAANPSKLKAKNAINNAIQSGKITRPTICSECPITSRIEAHHNDYALPLEVLWLCRACHIAWHKENGPGING